MKKKSKVLAIFMMTVLILSTLASCGDSQEKESKKDEEEKTKVEAKEESSKSEAKEEKKVEITMITAMAYGTEGLDIAADNFKKEHPNVELDIQHVPNDHSTVLKSRVNSGQFPDIVVAQTGSAVADYYDNAYDFTDDPIIEKFNQGAIEISKSSDGRILSLPWTYETMGIIYNKDVFEKAGITELPKTLDELEEVCKSLEEQGILPFATALKEQWVIAHTVSHFMANENEDPHITVDKISSGDLAIKDIENFDNVYRLLNMMVEYGPQKPLEVNWEISENKLAKGEAAMIHMGDWCEATLKDFNPDCNVGFMAVPVSDDPKDANLLSSISWQFLVNKESENAEIAKEFLEYILSSEDGINWMTQYVGAVPAIKTDVEPSGMLAKSAKVLIDKGETKSWNHILWPSGYNMEIGAYMQEYLLGSYNEDETTENINLGWLDEVE